MNISNLQDNSAFLTGFAEKPAEDAYTDLCASEEFVRRVDSELRNQRAGVVKALLYIYPEGFNSLAEQLGPQSSEELLRALGTKFIEQVGEDSLVARFGDSIFSVLLVKPSVDEVREVAETLLTSISTSEFTAGPQLISITASLGAQQLSQPIISGAQAFSLAQDAAKYAWESGGNQLHINPFTNFDDTLNPSDASLLEKVRAAVESKTFELDYEPIVSLNGAVTNLYAVQPRIQEKRQEDIQADTIIAIAERAGLMQDIDRCVIDAALADSKQDATAGMPSRLFLRISEASLQDNTFCNWLEERAELHKLVANSCVLQVSEHLAEHNLFRIKALASQCKKLGFQLAFCNVGVSDDCLQMINLIRSHYLHIDSSFTENLGDELQRLQLQLIASAAQDRGISTIVSRRGNAGESSALLRNLNIDYVAGHKEEETPETF